MNKKFEHTKRKIKLMTEMIEAGEYPVEYESGRGKIQQYFYYLTGVSKIDGITKKGKHDIELLEATDIYFLNIDTGEYIWDSAKFDKWHKRWEELGGAPMIIFKDGTRDLPHYEEI